MDVLQFFQLIERIESRNSTSTFLFVLAMELLSLLTSELCPIQCFMSWWRGIRLGLSDKLLAVDAIVFCQADV